MRQQTRLQPAGPRLEHVGPNEVLMDGKRLLYFGGCDYFRLSWRPELRKTLAQWATHNELNVAASRRTTGNHPLYETFEAEAGRFFQRDAAVLVSTGYMTNLIAAQGLAGEVDLALIDEKSHVSLLDAAKFLGCPSQCFRSRDVADLEKRLRKAKGKRVLVMTHGLFSEDGSVAPLKAYEQLLPNNSWMLIDDAHGAGVIGPTGRGSCEVEKVSGHRVILAATFSKAFGGYGGLLAGGTAFRKLCLNKSGMFAGNTPIPLPLIAMNRTALRLFQGSPDLLQKLRANVARIKGQFDPGALPSAGTPGPTLAVAPKSNRSRERLHKALLGAGILAPLIHYPGSPKEGYYRFAISSEHSREDLDRLCEVVAGWLEVFG